MGRKLAADDARTVVVVRLRIVVVGCGVGAAADDARTVVVVRLRIVVVGCGVGATADDQEPSSLLASIVVAAGWCNR